MAIIFIYADESGDHNLISIDKAYPVFVLSCCIFHKEDYSSRIVSTLKKLKFDIFGHDAVIFHEREIRQQEGPFNILRNPAFRENFYERINSFIETMPINVVACVIKKEDLRQRYSEPNSPYHLALGFCLERVASFLTGKSQQNKEIHLIVESRGKKEDNELELEFLRLINQIDIPNKISFNLKNIQFNLKFVSKQANMAGKQIADLIARPVGRYIIDPSQSNRAVDIIKRKIAEKQWQLKVFP